jgi:hypothetical protein
MLIQDRAIITKIMSENYTEQQHTISKTEQSATPVFFGH